MPIGSERNAVQNPFVRYAIEAGWKYVSPEEALNLRRGLTSPVLDSVLVEQLQRLNPGVVDHLRAEEVAKRLVRVRGRVFMLTRRYYEFVGQPGAYTRKKGLDREHNLALLLRHIEESQGTGCKLEELCQVLPSLPASDVQNLLRSLQRKGQVHTIGRTRAGLWYPGPPPESQAPATDV